MEETPKNVFNQALKNRTRFGATEAINLEPPNTVAKAIFAHPDPELFKIPRIPVKVARELMETVDYVP